MFPTKARRGSKAFALVVAGAVRVAVAAIAALVVAFGALGRAPGVVVGVAAPVAPAVRVPSQQLAHV